MAASCSIQEASLPLLLRARPVAPPHAAAVHVARAVDPAAQLSRARDPLVLGGREV